MKKTFIIAAAVLGLISCSKEKQLESRLDNQEWNIDKYKFEIANNGVVDPGQSVNAENAGSFKMDKGGTGTAQWNAGGNSRAFTITSWSTGVDSVKMELKDQSTQGTEKWNFSVTKNEKKTQEWYSVMKQGNFEFRTTFTLSRKK
jgi:hypothetical protein